MAGESTTGERTEEATPRKLREARKRGEVAKSKDVTATLGFAFVLALTGFGMAWGVERVATLVAEAVAVRQVPFRALLAVQGAHAAELFVLLSAAVLVPAAAVGMLVEFMQAGPVLTIEKMRPKLEHVDPVAGVKRMFGADNLVEVVKSLFKTAVLCAVLWLVVRAALDGLLWLPQATPAALVEAARSTVLRLTGYTLAIFLLVTAFDAAWQRHSFAKKQRMSIRDVRQEHKDNEGDPVMRNQRRSLHREWAQGSATAAARSATVVVVNPTHVAVALRYDPEDAPIPIVGVKGELEFAALIREAAHEAGVPVLRNEPLAWQLLRDVDEGDPVPRGLFDIVAEVVFWAQSVSASIDPAARRAESVDAVPEPPGTDLTRYAPA